MKTIDEIKHSHEALLISINELLSLIKSNPHLKGDRLAKTPEYKDAYKLAESIRQEAAKCALKDLNKHGRTCQDLERAIDRIEGGKS